MHFMKALLVLFLFISTASFSQTMFISGKVVDTSSHADVPLPQAMAMLIRIRDSVLIDFKRSDKLGEFKFENLPYDTLQLLVSHPNFGDQSYYIFGSENNASFPIKRIVLPPKSQEITEVVIYAYKDPIFYKGDTLVYVADSFATKPNAVVEDLLKKLPGLNIESDGKITSQGKEINKVLVDGDEFFGSDATIATKNLAASGVQTVEVYEKDAEDGSDEKIQVLDLRLKDDAKKGYFGKINLAGGLDQFVPNNIGFYEGEFLLNKYSKDQKIAVFGLGSNTPKTAINGNDLQKFGLGGGRNWGGNDSDDLPNYGGGDLSAGTGVPQTIKAGFYIDQKVWKGGRIRLNYSFLNYQVDARSSSLSQYILTDTSYTSDKSQRNFQDIKQHEIGIKYTQELDSFSRIEFEPKLTINLINDSSRSINEFRTQNNDLTRTTDLLNFTDQRNLGLNSTVRYVRDFRKKNRKLIVRYNISMDNDKSDGFLNTTDVDASTQILNYRFDQKKENRNKSVVNTAYFNYVEPIAKKWKTEFEYEYYQNNNSKRKSTFNPTNGVYEDLDSIYSNNFETVRQQHRAGAFLIYENAKFRVSAGTRVRTIAIDNRNMILDTLIKQDLNNFLPRAVLTIKFSQSSRFKLQYNTNSSLPSITQLMPVLDNTNPNSIQIGNPDLKPNYSHSLNGNYNMWKGLSGFYVYSGFSYTRQLNAFSSNTIFNNLGQSISQAINVDHADYLYYWAGAGIPIKKVKNLGMRINANGNFTSFENYINSERNVTKNNGIGGDFRLQYRGDSLNLEIGGGIDYNAPKNSLSTFSSQPYTNYDFAAEFDWTLPKRWFISSDATYTINTGRTTGYNISYVIWNASIQRSFLKTENLLFGIEAYDILNQNISNYRSVSNNVIVDQKTNIIRRYFMAKMTLKFNNNKTKEADYEGHW